MATTGSAGPTPITERAVPVAPSAPDSTDWPKQATDSIVRVVDNVRDKTAGPAVSAARGIVYGSILLALGLPLFILVLVGSMRALERTFIKIGETWDIACLLEPMWLVYLLFGAVFYVVGLRLWARAKRPAPAGA